MSYDAKEIWFYSPEVSTPQIRQAIEKFWKAWLPMHSTSVDLPLYHYTKLEGLKGIIRNRSIWFTHTSTLNDPTELIYGKQLILNQLNNELNKNHEEIIVKFLHALIGEINRFDKIMYETYVACFCESDNLLSQWRGYAHGGGGYNLGFSFTSDIKFYQTLDNIEKDSHIILRKIIYKENDQNQLIADYITSILSYAGDAIKYFQSHGGIPEIWELMAAMESANILCDLMLSFKNPVFIEENEWRLILVRQPEHKANQLKFRENEKLLIPYIETFIIEQIEGKSFFPLRSIKFGPMLDVLSTRSALKLFISKESAAESTVNINANGVRITDAGYKLRGYN